MTWHSGRRPLDYRSSSTISFTIVSLITSMFVYFLIDPGQLRPVQSSPVQSIFACQQTRQLLRSSINLFDLFIPTSVMTALEMLVVASHSNDGKSGSSETTTPVVNGPASPGPVDSAHTAAEEAVVANREAAARATTTTATKIATNNIKTKYVTESSSQLLPQHQQSQQQQPTVMNMNGTAPAAVTATATAVIAPTPTTMVTMLLPQLPKPSQLPKLFPAMTRTSTTTTTTTNVNKIILNAPTNATGGAAIAAISTANVNATTRGGGGGGQLLQFPWKLHEMLHLAEKNRKTNVISWLPGGNGFKVHNKELFCAEIMPGYFASQKYKTFQRSLNLWGFESVAKGPDRGACYHQYFVKGRPELCHSM